MKGIRSLMGALIAVTLSTTTGTSTAATAAAAVEPGSSVRADFDGDGRADLAVGVPAEDIGAIPDAGAVNVIYGSADGLTSAGDQLWTQNRAGVRGTSEENDAFGYALAAGDLNGDEYADLAVGAPLESVDGTEGAGAVNVLFGSADGLTAVGNQLWTQDSADVPSESQTSDGFGTSLAVLDLDGDGQADLVIGAPFEDEGTSTDIGAFTVLYGSADGPTAAGSQRWTQDSTDVPEDAETGDFFGMTLTGGDFGNGGQADLAIGTPGEDVGTSDDAGAVTVMYGSEDGLTAAGSQLWHRDSTDIEGDLAEGHAFGGALAAANFGNGAYADLAIGVPGDGTEAAPDSGAVNVIYGSADGLAATGDQVWTQDSAGIKDVAEVADQFGSSLAAANLGNGRQADLAIGSPSENVGTIVDAGSVNVLYGSEAGLTQLGDQYWTQDSDGIRDSAEGEDNFGFTIVAANFGGGPQADLAIGIPVERRSGELGAGAAAVLYGSSNGLTATGNQLWSQDSPGIGGTAERNDAFGWGLAGEPRG